MTICEQIKVVVIETEVLVPQVKRLTLRRLDHSPLPSFSAGAHIQLQFGTIKRQWRNQYSLTSDPEDSLSYQVAVKCNGEGRGGSLYLHRDLKVGEQLQISGPYNFFPLNSGAKRHLLIAGGIGITAIWSMARQLAREGADFEIHYAASSRQTAAFVHELSDLPSSTFAFYPSDRGKRLKISNLLERQRIGTQVYVCGPRSLIDEVKQTAALQGWPAHAVLSEAFTTQTGGEAFYVELLRQGSRIHVPEGVTLLEALEQVSVPVPFLCRMGACGFCETQVADCDGKIEHNDHILSEEQRDTNQRLYPCVSRFRGERLCLDL